MIAAVLLYALVDGIDGWAHLVVIGGIVMTVIGTMLAVDPNRKALERDWARARALCRVSDTGPCDA